MSDDRFPKAKELFLGACEQPEGLRAEFLAEACGADDGLRQEVESLLRFHDQSEAPAVSKHETTRGLTSPIAPAERIGEYRVLQRVGEGGMGEVWEAEQDEPVRRRVALKLIKRGMDTKEVVARFESERQALALMQHPNIATVFDAGVTPEGRPYFAMEFVQGVPLTEYCDTYRLTTEERLALLVKICDGVQHAHLKGVIHRDVKPSNILVATQDGQPVPKIIDFGVAKATAQRLTERTLFTELGQWIGTPEYMSPEQAGLTGLDVDTRTDVYSLGVVAYELLVGAQPFDSTTLRRAGFDEMRRRIREEEPPRPSTRVSGLGGDQSESAARSRRTEPATLARSLRGDLDWIVMKAIEKEPARRYESPAELARDVGRHLRHEPVIASPPSTAYRVRKFVRRHRVGVAAGGLVLAALVTGFTVASIGFIRARRAEALAADEARAARQVSGFVVGMLDGMNPERGLIGQKPSLEALLDGGSERLDAALAGQPLVRARLMTTMGAAYTALGHQAKGQELLQEALSIRERRLGPDHPDVAQTLTALSTAHYWQGDYADARSSLERALAIQEQEFGVDDVRVAPSALGLGFVLWRLGDYPRSGEMLERALEIQERALGPDHLDVAATLYHRAILRQSIADVDGARADLERSLAIREPQLGPDHLFVGWTLHDLGRVLRRSGDLAASRRHAERALAIHEAALGPRHSHVAYPLTNLTHTLSRLGDHDHARALGERALAIREAALGPDHPDVAWTLVALAGVHRRSGELDEARRLHERALAIQQRALGHRHPMTAWTLHGLARVASAAGDLRSARESILRALAINQEALGSEHRVLATDHYNLACVAALDGDADEAIARLRRAVELGFAHPVILDDPDLASLRGSPDLETLLAEVRHRLER